jgi:hypothetical protein
MDLMQTGHKESTKLAKSMTNGGSDIIIIIILLLVVVVVPVAVAAVQKETVKVRTGWKCLSIICNGEL